jgi:hypothetical protein
MSKRLKKSAAAFLFPTFQLMTRLLEQLEEGFDPPTKVIPQRNLGIAHRIRQIAEQNPFGNHFPPRIIETTHHQTQRQRRAGKLLSSSTS